MIPASNLLFCFLTAVCGVIAIHLAKHVGAKIILLISAFAISRIFAARAWVEITGSILYLSIEPAYWILLAVTIISMSILLIFPTQISIGFSWHDLGWKLNNLKRQIVGTIPSLLLLGTVIFASGFRNADPRKLLASAIFSFLIASWQEEVIFRGHLMTYLQQKGLHIIPVVILQALIFSLAHIGFAPLETLPYFLFSAFVLGGIFGAIRWSTDGQISGFLLHGMLNFMSLG